MTNTEIHPTIEEMDAARAEMSDERAVRIWTGQERYSGPIDVADYLFQSIDQGDTYALRIIALAFLDATTEA